MNRLGTIFWDFDGTLIYTRAMWTQGVLNAVKDHFPDKDLAISMMGAQKEVLPARELTLDAIRPHLQEGFPWHYPETPHLELNDPEAWWAALRTKFQDVFQKLGFDSKEAHLLSEKTQKNVTRPEIYIPYDDALAVLKTLKERGWQHIIVSNHVPELPAIVEAIGLGGLFDDIVVSASVGYEKPHPEIYALAKKAAGHSGPYWMVGDNVKADIQGAEAAGIPAILVHKPEVDSPRKADSLTGVADIIQKMSRKP